eukprot:CFRG1989T1
MPYTPSIPALGEDESPLRLFSDCRKEILTQFIKLKGVIDETENILESYERFTENENALVGLSQGRNSNGDGQMDHIHQLKDIHQFREVVSGITTMLQRDSMKVVFVGHTSNGKSTVINSMLGQKVLPTGIGHTTSCFCSVTGTDQEPYILLGEEDLNKTNGRNGRQSNGVGLGKGNERASETRLPITTVKTVANALCSPEATSENAYQFVRVFWDKSKCNLLGDGVMLVDTPGLDIDENYDSWIDKFCMDADVFVLVANGESTIKHTEMNFFTKVAEKLSRPNVFILFNRWDGSDMEDDISGVKAQHIDRTRQFFKKELQLQPDILDKRVFFVSSKEVLMHRTKPGKSVVKETNPLPLDRYKEFERFEREFEQCISLAAIRTKFEGHVVRGTDIVVTLSEWVKKVTWTAKMQRRECLTRLSDRKNHIETLDNQKEAAFGRCETLVQNMTTEIFKLFDTELKTLLDAQLSAIVMGFDYAIFRPNNTAVYKRRLIEYMSTEMSSELEARCAATLNKRYTRALRDMEDEMNGMVENLGLQIGGGRDGTHFNNLKNREAGCSGYSGSGMSKSSMSAFPGVSEECDDGEEFITSPPGITPIFGSVFSGALIDGFKEDIDFVFSLGWRSLGPRLLGYSKYRAVDSLLPLARTSSANVDGGRPESTPSPHSTKDQSADYTTMGRLGAIMAMVPMVSSITPHTSSIITIVTLGVTVLSKPSVWRAAAVAVGAYTTLYTVEFLTYTNAAREKKLKRQLVEYAYDHYYGNAQFSTMSVTAQYKHGAVMVLDDLKCQINEYKGMMWKEKGVLERAVGTLAKLVHGGESVEAHANEIGEAYEAYRQQYIL